MKLPHWLRCDYGRRIQYNQPMNEHVEQGRVLRTNYIMEVTACRVCNKTKVRIVAEGAYLPNAPDAPGRP